MNILFNNKELPRLITNLYTLTGIQTNIFDFSGTGICLTGNHAPSESGRTCPSGQRGRDTTVQDPTP